MIETTVFEIDVAELMERVRAETVRPKPPRRVLPPTESASLPPVAMLPAAPAVWIPGALKSSKERLDRLVETARHKNDGGSRVPKFLRKFFRKQGGYNRAVLDGVAALAKSNHELTQRVADITVCLGQFNSWLLALHEQSDADANWMKVAAPAFSKLERDLALIQNHLRSTDDNVQELWTERGNAAKRIAALETGTNERLAAFEAATDRRVADVRKSVEEIQQEIKGSADTTAAALEQTRTLQGEVDNVGIHLGNLQAQTEAISRQLADLKGETTKAASHRDREKDDLQHQVDLAGLHLRNLQAQADRLGVHLNDLQAFVDKNSAETIADAALVKGELSEYGALFRELLGDELDQPPRAVKKNASRAGVVTKAVPGLDAFYLAFENRFRGPRDVIKKRVEFYLPFVRKCRAGVSGRPALDLGCGRGEWLELLKEHKLDGRGIDLNTAMVAECKARGLKVELRDVIEHLHSLRPNTQGAVTGFHIIEHLPFEMLLELFRQARRVLKPGGVAIFESPNCKNLVVGACNFHIDPTHRHPVFPETAELMLSSQGFEKIQIEYLSPVADVKFAGNTAELAVIKDLLYGPQDFGIIAYKPKKR